MLCKWSMDIEYESSESIMNWIANNKASQYVELKYVLLSIE